MGTNLTKYLVTHQIIMHSQTKWEAAAQLGPELLCTLPVEDDFEFTLCAAEGEQCTCGTDKKVVRGVDGVD